MGDIFAVAEPLIKRLFDNDHLDFFRLDIPAKVQVPDHDTGPRILIFLTDLDAYRLADHSQINLPANTVMYLDNDFSPGFCNGEHALSYLVLSTAKLAETETVKHPSIFTTVLTTDSATVCKCNGPHGDCMPHPGLIYHTSQGQSRTFEMGQQVQVTTDDWLVFLTPALLARRSS